LAAVEHIAMDYVVTVCDAAQEACPYVPARIRVIHKGFPQPSAEGTTEAEKRASFRRVRDEIKRWLDTVFVPETRHPEASTL
jgi:arsenate reductase